MKEIVCGEMSGGKILKLVTNKCSPDLLMKKPTMIRMNQKILYQHLLKLTRLKTFENLLKLKRVLQVKGYMTIKYSQFFWIVSYVDKEK